MKITTPKQFVEFCGKPLIVYSLEAFNDTDVIDKIIVVCKDGYQEELKKIIIDNKLMKPYEIIKGGATHQESLTNALDFINKNGSEKDIVVIHNANRPMVTKSLIEDSVKVCKEFGNGVSSITCVDTMMNSKDGISSTSFVNRDEIFRAQSPQTYHLSDIYFVYDKARKEGLNNCYECDLMTRYGKRIYFSKGSSLNIKLTTREDILIIDALLKSKSIAKEIK